jgi:1,4-dihydroxy-2-naphthoate octaprenyltransferase
MATPAQWVEGARPRTLPAAVAPVLVGTGAAYAAGSGVVWKAVLALAVSLALQVGVNYANDYSDGIRGTDAVRVGPFRLVGSGSAAPAAVKRAAFLAFGLAAVLGLVLAITTSWWLIAVGAASIAAAWFYTGGSHPYGYAGLGELFVFVFFGLVAVCGTTFVQVERVTSLSLLVAVPVGFLACAILVANNLRDIPTDTTSGKRTLAVRLGDRRTRGLYAVLVLTPFVVPFLAPLLISGSQGGRRWWPLLALLAAPLVLPPLRTVLRGARGRDLIPVLRDTGRLQLAYAVLLGLGLAVS